MRKSDKRASFDVLLDANELGPQQRVGTLYTNGTRTDMPASFEYETGWLESRHAFMLDPRLALWTGEQHPQANAPAFGVFMDSCPDRWGRVLMERREAAQAKREGRPARTLQELDFLLGVQDLTRMGALRFRANASGPFLDNNRNAAPPLTRLAELAHIARRIEEEGAESLPEYEKWLALLIAPGTSLGGARPKASFTDADGQLWIAKFPAHDDRYDVGGWEIVTHRLAHKAGVWVPASRLEAIVPRYGTFCVARFDRRGAARRMYASAMTLLERQDGATGASYLDIAQFISDFGAKGHIDGDLAQLFRRVIFNVMVGNRDDHLRNHGFIRETNGWRLCDAFDMNPNTSKGEHSLALDDKNAQPDISTVLSTAGFYRLDKDPARAIVQEVRAVVATWKDEAARYALPASEVRRMATVIQI